MKRLLVIDDEPNVRRSISEILADDGLEILEADTAAEGLRLVQSESPDVTLIDIRLDDGSGVDLFHKLRSRGAATVVIFMTGFGTAELAIETMSVGAFDYLVKPIDPSHLKHIVEQALTVNDSRNAAERAGFSHDEPERLIGSGPVMQGVYKQIGRLASQGLSVLLVGESGTGKELVARAIHHHSRRSGAPFRMVSCAAMSEAALEVELFGQQADGGGKAAHHRLGQCERTHGGTIFLDEVACLPAGVQAKLLRLLQEGNVERVGGTEPVAVDVRILAATTQNIEALVAQGQFRKDLYYRLRGATIHLPPLRERREDIAELAHYFLFRCNDELGTALQSIAPETLEELCQYGWPGNVHELQSVIREAAIISSGPVLLPEFLPDELHGPAADEPTQEPEWEPVEACDDDWRSVAQLVDELIDGDERDIYRRIVHHVDRMLISRVLEHAKGNQGKAAEMLGLSRVTLRAKMRSMGLGIERVLARHSDETRG